MFKRFSGLYAVIVAISLFVAGFPVAAGADDGNLIGELNCGFETGDLAGWSTNIEPQVTAQAARTGNYGAVFVATESSKESNLRYVNRPYSHDQLYRFSGYVKAGDETSVGKKVKLIAQRSGGGKTTHGTMVGLTDEWQEIDVVFSYPLESGQNYKVHIGMHADTGAMVCVDDFSLTEFTLPEFTVSTQVFQPDGKAVIEYTFSTPLKSDLTVNSFEVIGTAAEKSISKNGNKYILTLSGVTPGTEYTVNLIDAVTDMYDRTITQNTVSFTTPELSLVPNGSFETGDLSGWSSNVNPEVTSESARTGNYGVRLTTSTDGSEVSNLRYTNQPYSNNQLYRFSGYVKAGEATSIGKKIKLIAQRSSGGKTTHGTTVELTDEWQKISVEYSYPLESGQNYKVHIGVYVSGGATICADDFVLEEIIPEGLYVEYNVEDVDQSKAVIKYTFSNALVPGCINADSFIVTGGSADKELTNEGNIYTLTLSGLSQRTEYSVKLADVATDIYGGTVTDTTVTFMTTDPENILKTYGRNPDMEAGLKDPWNSNVEFTVAEGTGVNGSYGASYISTGTNENMRLVNVPYEDGEYYVFSGYVRTDVANSGKSIALTAQQAGGGSTVTGSSYNLTNKWQKINVVFNLPNKTSNFKVHLGVMADSGAVVYADEFSLMKYDPITLTYANISDNQNGVSISQKVVLTFNNTIADMGDFSGCFSMRGVAVKKAVLSEDGKTITAEFKGLLKPHTEYTLTIKNVKDVYSGEITPFQIKFKTGDALSVNQAPVVYKNGIAQSKLTPGEYTVKSVVQNNTNTSCEKPVMIVTVYDENGFMIDVKSTEFGGMLSYQSDSNTLELALPITVTSDAAYVTAHIWKAAGNISYMQAPVKMAVEN